MNPSDFQSRLPEYADGELDPELRTRIEAHLTEDPAAAMEVERWQTLRQCARRGLESEALPAGLEDRIRAGLSGAPAIGGNRSRPRIYRLGISGLSAAAVLVLAVLLMWPRGAGASPSLDADYLAGLHRKAAKEHPDTLDVRHGEEWDRFIASLPRKDCQKPCCNPSFPCVLPSSIGHGYQLTGASELKHKDNICLVHAYFLCKEAGGNIMSLFVISCPVELKDKQGPGRTEQGQRTYRIVESNAVTFLFWTEGSRTFVLSCGIASPQQLRTVADKLDLRPTP